MLGVGLALWLGLWLMQDKSSPELAWWLGPWRWAAVALLTAVGALPAVHLRLAKAMDRLAEAGRSPSVRLKMAVVLAVVAALYFAATAHLQGRDLFPKTHDDQSYLLQMRLLASGRLWTAAPAHPDFFDSFYVITRPVYASLYFPGAALMYVPTIWLNLPTWVMPICVAGAIVGLFFRIVAELVDAPAALLAAMGLVALSWFRIYSVLLTSHEPMLLLGLLMIWGCLRWRRADGARRRAGWAVVIGIIAGWAAITRPADALCFATPIAVAMAIDSGRAPGRMVRTAMLLVAGAAPFLSLQAVFNVGVTGNVFETPYSYYLRQDQPNTGFGFQSYDPAARPASTLPQKQAFYDSFYAPFVRRHTPGQTPYWWSTRYLPLAADVTLPGRALILFLPVGLLGLMSRRRWLLPATVPLLLVVYVFNTFFLEHYALMAAPAVLMLAVMGVRQVSAAWPRGARGAGGGFPRTLRERSARNQRAVGRPGRAV